MGVQEEEIHMQIVQEEASVKVNTNNKRAFQSWYNTLDRSKTLLGGI